MIRVVFLFLLFNLTVFSKEFIVASYNVENLFDLNNNRSDYKEYTPNTKSKWNKKTYNQKIKNLIKVIKDINADIIALQEIENKELLKVLQKKLPEYSYISFAKYKNSSVGLGFLSKIKITSSKTINVKFSDKLYRPILESNFTFENIEFKIFNNHWPSKRVAESYRLKYAKRLYDRIKELPKHYDYILLGDFNSNYNEYQTIFYNKRLNNSDSITGINHLLNTVLDKRLTSINDLKEKNLNLHYNLWLDLSYENRFSTIYKGQNNTPDNIILPYSLFDNKKISYIKNSFEVFKPSYLYRNGKINRWQMKNRVHLGLGYSDHLPILAKFTTKKENEIFFESNKKQKIEKISQLYKLEKLKEEILLKDVLVIYKNKDNAIMKQKNDRAIYIYKNAKNLKEGFSYDLKVSQIKDFHGLKEIESFEIKKENSFFKDYRSLYKDKNTDIFDLKNQNEIITNLSGFYKKGYFYFKEGSKEKRVKLYSKNRDFLPKKSRNISLKKAHIGYYKSKVQLVIYNRNEIDVN